jgi:hypothetical protein
MHSADLVSVAAGSNMGESAAQLTLGAMRAKADATKQSLTATAKRRFRFPPTPTHHLPPKRVIGMLRHPTIPLNLTRNWRTLTADGLNVHERFADKALFTVLPCVSFVGPAL